MAEPHTRATGAGASASRHVHEGDGLAWLREHPLDERHALITSLPDVSELGGVSFDSWRAWFIDTAELLCRATAPRAVTIFYQTDIKRDGRWIDKGFLVMQGAERADVGLLFHKVVCRVPPGQTTFGRPAYAHLLAFSRELLAPPGESTPDVIPRLGQMTWSRAMGTDACAFAARFVRDRTPCSVIVDPFCGMGTMLAMANAHGLDALGVELAHKRAKRARNLTLTLDP